LAKVGAADPVIALGDVMKRGEFRTASGRLMQTADTGAADGALGYPSILIHRADLLSALLSCLPMDVVRYGHECTAVRQDSASATAEFLTTTGPSSATADLLIGADGIHSIARERIRGREPTRYSGYTCWRGIAPFPTDKVPPGYACEVWGRGARFGITRIGGGRVYWWATRNAPESGRDESPDAARSALLADFGRWFDPIPAMIAATAPGAIIRNDIIDRPPVRGWSKGRITLLGDAAHPTTPNLGQGGCMAIVDGVVLARCLRESADIPSALAAYERERSPVTRRVTDFSWRLGAVGQWSSPALCALRDAAMSIVPRRSILKSHARIVGHDVPA
jgi:2-polyprenyl-6-methoxyphenol hydroxylase-like FAD-dependent oxidoreductase